MKILYATLVLCINLSCFSQVKVYYKQNTRPGLFQAFYPCVEIDSNTIIFDPLDTASSIQVLNWDIGFLIDESKYYEFEITRIDKFSQGYVVYAHTRIHGVFVRAFIVTTNSKQIGTKKIRKGKKYMLKLIKYYERPLVRVVVFNHSISTYNVLINTNSINILSYGSISYIHVSPNLEGLYYIEPSIIDSLEEEKNSKIKEIESLICEFMPMLFQPIDTIKILNFVDTVLLKRTLLGLNRGVFRVYYPGKSLPKKIPSDKKSKSYIDVSNCETSSFFSIYTCFINKEFISTNKPQIKPSDCDNLEFKILRYFNNVYTIRVQFNVPNSRYTYLTELSIKNDNDNLKVIGINKYRFGYKFPKNR